MDVNKDNSVVIELSNSRTITIYKSDASGPFYAMLTANAGQTVISLATNEMLMLANVGQMLEKMEKKRIKEGLHKLTNSA